MAGSDQSVNLGGMLTNISDTIGGMSAAGEGYNNAFINAFKPQIDPSSPESLQAAAQWASNNGRAEEAAAYRKEASVVGLRNTELATKEAQRVLGEKAHATLQLASDAKERGDLEALSKAEDQMNDLIKGAPLEAHDSIRKGAEAINNMRQETLGNKTTNEASGAVKLDSLLKDEEFRKKAGENLPILEDKLESLLDDPKILEAFNAQVEQDILRDTQAQEQKNTAEARVAEKEINRLINAKDFEGAVKYAGESKFPELVKPYVDLAKSLQELEKVNRDDPASTYNFRLKDAEDMAERLRRFDSLGFDTGTAGYVASIEGIKNDKTMPMSQKSKMLAEIRKQMFTKDNELSRTAYSAVQSQESQKRTAEGKAASARPSKLELKAFRSQQSEATPMWKVWATEYNEAEVRNAYSDVIRANNGLPTAHYEVKNGAVVFDKGGQPVPRDPNNGYRTAAEIGTDLGAVAKKETLAVSTEEYEMLKADGVDMSDYRLDTTLDGLK